MVKRYTIRKRKAKKVRNTRKQRGGWPFSVAKVVPLTPYKITPTLQLQLAAKEALAKQGIASDQSSLEKFMFNKEYFPTSGAEFRLDSFIFRYEKQPDLDQVFVSNADRSVETSLVYIQR